MQARGGVALVMSSTMWLERVEGLFPPLFCSGLTGSPLSAKKTSQKRGPGLISLSSHGVPHAHRVFCVLCLCHSARVTPPICFVFASSSSSSSQSLRFWLVQSTSTCCRLQGTRLFLSFLYSFATVATLLPIFFSSPPRPLILSRISFRLSHPILLSPWPWVSFFLFSTVATPPCRSFFPSGLTCVRSPNSIFTFDPTKSPATAQSLSTRSLALNKTQPSVASSKSPTSYTKPLPLLPRLSSLIVIQRLQQLYG